MLIFVVGLALTACGGARSTASDPTIAPLLTRPAQRVTTAAPIPISLENLAANPDFFVGATLQLSGQFRRLPILSCRAEKHASPATWGLVSGGFLANGAGMDQQLRSLIDEGQSITVEGRWLKYEGLVGCGDQAKEESVWYLSTDRVLDPHPLVQARSAEDSISVAPGATDVAAAALPTETAAAPPTVPTPDLEVTDASAPTVTSAAPPETEPDASPAVEDATSPPVASATSAAQTTPAATTDATGAPTVTIGPGTSQPTVEVTATATVQFSEGTATTTATVTATAGASATPPSGGVVEKGSLDTEDLRVSTLGVGSTDLWTMDLSAGQQITITVAPGATADIRLSVLDSNDTTVVDQQNLAPGGSVETIVNLAISAPGIYELHVQGDQTAPLDYALMLMDEESYSFEFRGLLQGSATRSESLAENTDHFWFFAATSGQEISFTITPSSNGDPYVELYDPNGTRILTLDDTGEGESETLESRTLTNAGLYGIRVAEFDFRPMTYQLNFSKS